MSNTTNSLVIDKNNKPYDIHPRIYSFIIRVIRLVNSLPKTESNKIITNQLLRCVTSIGANDQEADGSLTKKDFLHTYTIVRKESKETYFWLSLIADTNIILEKRMKDLLKENQEIVAIISSIINKTRSN